MRFRASAYDDWFGVEKRKKKAKKPPKENFFERLTVAQLKELLRTVRRPLTGARADLIARLLADERAGEYADEARASTAYCTRDGCVGLTASRNGWSIESLKDACRARALSPTGTKFELILRLLRHESGDDAGGAPGRGASHQPRRRAPTPPPTGPANLDQVHERATRAIETLTHTRFLKWVCALIDKEAVENPYARAHPVFAAEVAEVACAPIFERSWDSWWMRGWEEYEPFVRGLCARLVQIFRAARGALGADARARHHAWVGELHALAYGVDPGWFERTHLALRPTAEHDPPEWHYEPGERAHGDGGSGNDGGAGSSSRTADWGASTEYDHSDDGVGFVEPPSFSPQPSAPAPAAVPSSSDAQPRCRAELAQLPVRELRRQLEARGLGHADCVEKGELVERLDRAELVQLRVKELRCRLEAFGVEHADCIEKWELVERLLATRQAAPLGPAASG